ncbi:Tim44/TimA family putative adaptor protein [Oceanicaulis sp.]|uniref:Tim44/TimA family putative adaptor protein n=1 Tax=Oceanicaulis sp. TaxID=1924941 RepID=UPI003F723427
MDILQILFFAGLAVFLGVRLYMVLGKPSGRTAEDVEREQRERAEAAGAMPSPPSMRPPQEDTPFAASFSGPAGEGLTLIAQQDPSFDPKEFTKGAKAAYEMIVTAYAKGDREALQPLLSDRVMKAYDQAIKAREDQNLTMTTEIDRIKSAEISEASLNDNRAKVKIAFSAELASETRNAQGDVVEGDLTTLKTVDEIWSFERDVTNDNPNWRLSGVKPA